jgi:hypothetical protein
MKLLPVIQPAAIRNEEPDHLLNILWNAHPAQRNRGHGLHGNPKRLCKVGADSIRSGRGGVAGSTVFTRTPCGAISVASVLLHALIAAFADE